jgi:hypothetical protein
MGTTTGPGASGTAPIEAETWIKGVGVGKGAGVGVIVIVVVIVGEDEGVDGTGIAVAVGGLTGTSSNCSAASVNPRSWR